MQWLLKDVGSEKDNSIRIDRDKDGQRDTQAKILLYNPKGCVCKIDLTFTLALRKRSKSSIFTSNNEQSILT
jgi:hypothetical protein